jgi:hypothetical protein
MENSQLKTMVDALAELGVADETDMSARTLFDVYLDGGQILSNVYLDEGSRAIMSEVVFLRRKDDEVMLTVRLASIVAITIHPGEFKP